MFCLYISLTPTWSLCHKVMILVNTLQNLGFPSFPSVKFICRQCTYLCLGSNWSFFAIIIKVSSEFWILNCVCIMWWLTYYSKRDSLCFATFEKRDQQITICMECAKALSWVCDICFQLKLKLRKISSYIIQKIHDN